MNGGNFAFCTNIRAVAWKSTRICSNECLVCFVNTPWFWRSPILVAIFQHCKTCIAQMAHGSILHFWEEKIHYHYRTFTFWRELILDANLPIQTWFFKMRSRSWRVLIDFTYGFTFTFNKTVIFARMNFAIWFTKADMCWLDQINARCQGI